MQDEQWRPIPGFPGYEVSDHGRVLSRRRGAPRVLVGRYDEKGYRSVTLVDPGGRSRYPSVHSLVLAAFVGPRPVGLEIRHMDGVPDNNAVSNLQYGTRVENSLDKRRHGTDHNVAKAWCPKGHPYDNENTYMNKGKRYCRACGRARTAEWERRRATA